MDPMPLSFIRMARSAARKWLPVLFFVFVQAGVAASSAFCAEFEMVLENGQTQLYYKHADRRILIGSPVRLSTGARFYHWGSAGEGDHLAEQQKITQAELDSRMANPEGNQGGGFYISMDAWDTHSYGPKLTVLELERPALVIQTRLLRDVKRDFASYAELQGALIQAGIDGTYYLPSTDMSLGTYSGDRWLNVFNAGATGKVRAGSIQDLLGGDGILSPRLARNGRSLIENILEINSRYEVEDGPWLREHAPELSKLLRGTPLSPGERRRLASAISFQQEKDSSRLATKLKAEFHREYVQKVKSAFDPWLTPIVGSDIYPEHYSAAVEQHLEIAKHLGVTLSEVFEQNTLRALRRSYPGLGVLRQFDSDALASCLERTL